MSVKSLKIIDDEGMIAIVNAKSYNETLHFQQQWTWKQLNDFLLKQNAKNSIVFGTGIEAEWTLQFLINEVSDQPYFRKFEHVIEVTDGSLYVVSWSDITSTLQFEDTYLPDDMNRDLNIEINNGLYRVVVKQLSDPEDYDYNTEGKVNFIIELFPNGDDVTALETMVWIDDFPTNDTLFLSNEKNEFDDLLDSFFKDGK